MKGGRLAETSRIEWAESARATEVLVSPEIRETMAALAKLGGVDVSPSDVAGVLGLQPSTTQERLKKAIDAGLVVKSGHGKYTLATQLVGV